jgi:hypothetical protein
MSAIVSWTWRSASCRPSSGGRLACNLETAGAAVSGLGHSTTGSLQRRAVHGCGMRDAAGGVLVKIMRNGAVGKGAPRRVKVCTSCGGHVLVVYLEVAFLSTMQSTRRRLAGV